MSLNKEIIFGLSSFGDDDMLFPDYSHILVKSSRWTATEDCFVVMAYYGSESNKAGSLYIDNVEVVKPVGAANSYGYVFFSGYVAKGSSLRTSTISGFTAYGLKQGGG